MTRPRLFTVAALAVTLLAGTASAYDGEQYVVCNLNPNGDNFLALRTCGATKCDMKMKLGPGTFVITMEPYSENGWRPVIVQNGIQDWSYAGPSGWVYDKYICEVRY
ncbi:hypothetical protein [Aliiroseovarius subalbicans]|uniref:hypothetical protein n=1 Tax=Aliiroseovarius subalbicans TaxID=2925840 RepID=UPI001F5AEBF8|nr:hypothetical protein [Aliiroseovarius subalbicans]MCI2400588.1 hypothetical protein [Aliiroseovarius subalbicans]